MRRGYRTCRKRREREWMSCLKKFDSHSSPRAFFARVRSRDENQGLLLGFSCQSESSFVCTCSRDQRVPVSNASCPQPRPSIVILEVDVLYILFYSPDAAETQRGINCRTDSPTAVASSLTWPYRTSRISHPLGYCLLKLIRDLVNSSEAVLSISNWPLQAPVYSIM